MKNALSLLVLITLLALVLAKPAVLFAAPPAKPVYDDGKPFRIETATPFTMQWVRVDFEWSRAAGLSVRSSADQYGTPVTHFTWVEVEPGLSQEMSRAARCDAGLTVWKGSSRNPNPVRVTHNGVSPSVQENGQVALGRISQAETSECVEMFVNDTWMNDNCVPTDNVGSTEQCVYTAVTDTLFAYTLPRRFGAQADEQRLFAHDVHNPRRVIEISGNVWSFPGSALRVHEDNIGFITGDMTSVVISNPWKGVRNEFRCVELIGANKDCLSFDFSESWITVLASDGTIAFYNRRNKAVIRLDESISGFSVSLNGTGTIALVASDNGHRYVTLSENEITLVSPTIGGREPVLEGDTIYAIVEDGRGRERLAAYKIQQ